MQTLSATSVRHSFAAFPTGVALTAVLSKFLFKDPLTWLMSLGIILIIGGVLLIELGATH